MEISTDVASYMVDQNINILHLVGCHFLGMLTVLANACAK